VGVTGFVAPGFFLNKSQSTAAAPASSPVQPPKPAAPTAPPTPGGPAAPPQHRATPLPDPSICQYPPDQRLAAPKPAARPSEGPSPANGTSRVTLETTAGPIPIVVDRALAPCTVHSFLTLAKNGFYTGTACHRLGTQGLQMLQCGDPKGDGTGGPGYRVNDENFPQLRYPRGTLALAKSSEPNSGGSQFFMVFGAAPINPDYPVFGTVTDDGLRVLDAIARAGVDPAQTTRDGTGRPRIPVQFTAVTVGP
jgi:peptidyl-prolyl cis-trans isomerase B (cyclophilin B)